MAVNASNIFANKASAAKTFLRATVLVGVGVGVGLLMGGIWPASAESKAPTMDAYSRAVNEIENRWRANANAEESASETPPSRLYLAPQKKNYRQSYQPPASQMEEPFETIIIHAPFLDAPQFNAPTPPPQKTAATAQPLSQFKAPDYKAPDYKSNALPGAGGAGGLRHTSIDDLLTPLSTNPAEIKATGDTFRKMVAMAVETNPVIMGAKNIGAIKNEGVKEAEGALYPQVGLRLSGGRGVVDPGASYVASGHGRTDLVLSASQLIYDFDATLGRVDAARFEERATAYENINTINGKTIDTIAAYLTVVNIRENVRLAERNVNRHKEFAGMVAQRIAAKVAPTSDRDRIVSKLASAQAQLTGYIGDMERAEAVFREQFNQPAGDINFPVLGIALPPESEETIVVAINSHPNLKMHEMRVRAANRSRDAARGDNLPRFQLEVDATRYDVDPTSSIPNSGGSPNSAVARLNIIYDLFDGGSGRARENKANYQAMKVQNDYDSYRRELERDIRYMFANARAKEQALAALKLSISSNLATVNAKAEQYKMGRSELINLLDAQSELYRSATAYSLGRAESVVARFSLLMFTGKLLDYFEIDTANLGVNGNDGATGNANSKDDGGSFLGIF